jgi:hypothetical protein
MEACWRGDVSELNDGLLDRRKAGVPGELLVKLIFGVELRDLLGW